MSVAGHGVEVLTNRERQVAELVFEGLANKEIAQKLSLSERTVETHVASICNRLGFRSRVQIATWVAGQKTAPPAAMVATTASVRAADLLPPWPVLAVMAAGLPLPIVAVAYQWSQPAADAALNSAVTAVGLGLLALPAVSLAAMARGLWWAGQAAVAGLLWLSAAAWLLAAYEIGMAWTSTGAIKVADGFELAYAALLLPLLLIDGAAIVGFSRRGSWARPLITVVAAFWILRFGYGLSLAVLVLWLVWRPARPAAQS